MSITTPGLLLQTIPYLGEKKILKIFTPEQGLLSLFARKTKLAPFCLAEWIYRKTEKEIHTIQDSTLLDPLLHLRDHYHVLVAAGAIASDLLKTQMPGKKAPALFELALFYLRKLSSAPDLFVASFRLKLLVHEGLFSETPDPSFSALEWEEVHTLAFSRKLSAIQTLPSAPHAKIQLLFHKRFNGT
ncbi:MAG: DNA repair protein RecO [Chlamydiales bacterium]